MRCRRLIRTRRRRSSGSFVVMRDRTSVIISHRVSTVREADMICVLDEGRIIEQGTHDELSSSVVSMQICMNGNCSRN